MSGRRLMIACLAGVLTVVLLSWRFWPGAPSRAGAVQASTAHSEVAGGAPAVQVAASSPVSATTPEKSKAPLPDGWIEVCGAAPIPREAMERVLNSGAAGVEQVYADLRASGDARLQAAGLALSWQRAQHPSAGEDEAAALECGVDSTCLRSRNEETRTRVLAASQRHGEALVRLALDSRDAAIYAMAVQMCRAPYASTVTACGQVSLAQWARTEVDNMAPWRMVAERAEGPGADTIRANAYHRAMVSTRNDNHERLLFESLLERIPADMPAPVQAQVWAEVFGLWSSQMTTFGAENNFCRAPALLDANRRQLCDGLAQALATHARSRLDLYTATFIGQRTGWAPQRLARLREDIGLPAMIGELAATGDEPLSCRGLRAMRGQARDLAKWGEVGAGRAAIAQADPRALQEARSRWAALEQQRVARLAAEAGSAAAKPPTR